MSMLGQIAAAASALSLIASPVAAAGAPRTPKPNDIIELPVIPFKAVGCKTTSKGRQYYVNISITFGVIAKEKDLPRVIPPMIGRTSNLSMINKSADDAINQSLVRIYETGRSPSRSSQKNADMFGADLVRRLNKTLGPVFAPAPRNGQHRISIFFSDVSGTVQEGCDLELETQPALPQVITYQNSNALLLKAA